MSRYFPKAKASKPAKPAERRPRDWRNRTHVLIQAGQSTFDGRAICEECGYPEDHAIHDLNVSTELSEVERRKLGERE